MTAAIATSQSAPAYEPFFAVNTTPGITTGILLGANPPQGLYFINLAYGGPGRFSGIGASNGLSGFTSDIITEVPVLLWTTPWSVLGASWAVAVAAPVVTAAVFDGPTTVASVSGFHNPGFSPIMLSWTLGGGVFAKLGVNVWSPHGTISAGPLNNGLANIGAPYWTIEPHVAVSYLGKDWTLTAHLIYGISTRNTYSNVTNGVALNLDVAATRKIGKFEIGPVAYFSTQVTSDSGCEAFYGAGVCAPGEKAGVGALIGYDLGTVSAKLAVTDTVRIRNSNDGLRVWSTLTLKLR